MSSSSTGAGSSSNAAVHWQEAKKEVFSFDLQFDVKEILNIFPKLNLERDDMLRVLPKKLDSQIYHLKFDGLNTTWKIFLKLKEKKDEDLGLGLYLELLDWKESLLDAGDAGGRNGRNSGGGKSKVDSVYAKFSVSLFNNVDATVLTFDAGFHKFDKHEPDWGFAKLFTLDEFWNKKNLYYPDGTLRIRIPLKLMGSLTYSGVEPPQPTISDKHLPPRTKKFMEDVLELFTTGRETDFKITCGAKVFNVHKAILSARSPVLRRMLESNMTEARTGNIHITDIEPEIMKILLKFIYCAKNPVPDLDYDELIGLIKASEKYELEEVKNLCLPALIRDHMNLEKCGEIAVLAYLHGAEKSQKQTVYEYCIGHWSTLTRDSEFTNLVQRYPGAFFVPEK